MAAKWCAAAALAFYCIASSHGVEVRVCGHICVSNMRALHVNPRLEWICLYVVCMESLIKNNVVLIDCTPFLISANAATTNYTRCERVSHDCDLPTNILPMYNSAHANCVRVRCARQITNFVWSACKHIYTRQFSLTIPHLFTHLSAPRLLCCAFGKVDFNVHHHHRTRRPLAVCGPVFPFHCGVVYVFRARKLFHDQIVCWFFFKCWAFF